MVSHIRIGTRASPLALWQAHHVSALLHNAVPDLTIELVEIQTEGDQVRDVPLAKLGGEGVFTKAIQTRCSRSAWTWPYIASRTCRRSPSRG